MVFITTMVESVIFGNLEPPFEASLCRQCSDGLQKEVPSLQVLVELPDSKCGHIIVAHLLVVSEFRGAEIYRSRCTHVHDF